MNGNDINILDRIFQDIIFVKALSSSLFPIGLKPTFSLSLSPLSLSLLYIFIYRVHVHV